MTPRRRDEEPEAFEGEFDDGVFDDRAGADERPASRDRPRARTTRSRAGISAAAPPTRGRRALRWLGALALVGLLAAFVISFVTGLGATPDERVTGDAQQGGRRLDGMGPRVRVEVLNAAGVAGLARRATEHLRDRGFDVVAFGNAAVSGQARTIVFARTSDVDDARAVAAALGVDSVALEPDPQLFLDVTVQLGRDWPPTTDSSPPAQPGFGGRFKRWLSAE